MTGRRRGPLLIGAVALLLVVVANLRPSVVAGSARSTPVPDPPAVGDCILDAPLPAPQMTANSWPSSGLDYPRQHIGRCAGARFGEVAAVIATPRVPVMAGDAADQYIDDPNSDSCYESTQRYVGLSSSAFPAPWTPLLRITSAMSAPSLRQQAAGQHWAACVVGVVATDGNGDRVVGSGYDTTIRNALSTGAERNQLGSCRGSTDWQDDSFIDCALPHQLELFALGSTTDSSGISAQLQQGCADLVGRLTAMPDPTAGGALSVELHVGSSAPDRAGQQLPVNTSLECGVVAVGHRLLAGSLLALGHRPVPWA